MAKLDGNTFLIYNKEYEHAKLAQWGTDGRDVGTYEQHINPDQLWFLEASSKYPEYYYINNALHEGYRLTKWGSGDQEAGVNNGQYYDNQLWKFQQEGDYYRIYNKEYPSAKIAKWGKGDGDWGTYDGSNYDDQLWKLVPRFEASAQEDLIWSCDNRQGSTAITQEETVTIGVKLTEDQSLTTKVGFEYSLKLSLSAGIKGYTPGLESQLKLSQEIESSILSSRETSWWKTTKTSYTALPGKNYQVWQTRLDFSSPLDSDNCSLFCQERITESS